MVSPIFVRAHLSSSVVFRIAERLLRRNSRNRAPLPNGGRKPLRADLLFPNQALFQITTALPTCKGASAMSFSRCLTITLSTTGVETITVATATSKRGKPASYTVLAQDGFAVGSAARRRKKEGDSWSGAVIWLSSAGQEPCQAAEMARQRQALPSRAAVAARPSARPLLPAARSAR